MSDLKDQEDMITLTPPPYKEAFTYIGPDDAFVSLSWYSLYKRKYEREKIRLGIRGLKDSHKQKLLDALAEKINKEVEVRNKKRLYHEQTVPEHTGASTGYNDGLILEQLQVFRSDKENPEYQKALCRAVITRYSKFSEEYPAMGMLHCSALDKFIIKKYISFLQEKGNVGKTINEHLWLLSKLLEKLRELPAFSNDLDPEKYRLKQIKNETDRYKPLTFEEKDAIFTYFQKRSIRYKRFLLFQYYTCIRPGESTRLQIEYIDLNNRTIYVPWLKAKNGLSKYVQILEPLYRILIEMELHKYQKTDYLFSHGFEPGSIKKSENQLGVTFHEACGELGIVDKQMYGLKHTFNKDYVENNKHNIDWEWLRRHNRHATIQQTQEYISGLTAYFLDESAHTILDHTKM